MSFFATVAPEAQRRALPLQAQCGACGLHRKCRNGKLPVQGSGRRKILVVGEHPTKDEDASGAQFSANSNYHLWSALRRHGVERDDCWVTSALRCWPGGRDVPERAIDHCRPFLVEATRELEPELVLLLGYRAVQSCVGWLWKDDIGARLERWVGHRIPSQALNAWVCPTWHPSDLCHDSGREGRASEAKKLFFERHVEAALSLEGRPWPDGPPDYRRRVEVVQDPAQAAQILDEFTASGGRVAWDIETTSIKPDRLEAEIYCCSVCWEGRRTVAYPWVGPAVAATERLLRSSVKKIGYNMTFESRWVRAKLGFWVKNWVWDGMLAAHTLDSRPGATGLKFQAFVRLGQDVYNDRVEPYLSSKKEGGDNAPNCIREAPLYDVLLYCGMDALLEWEVAMRQAKQMGVEL